MRQWFNYFVLGVGVAVFLFGAYVGYLNALVDLDEIFQIQKVQADSDLQYLAFQEKRLESILEAKRRALIRRREQLAVGVLEIPVVEESFAPPLTPHEQFVPVESETRTTSAFRSEPVVTVMVSLQSQIVKDEKELSEIEAQYTSVVQLQQRLQIQKEQQVVTAQNSAVGADAESSGLISSADDFRDRIKKLLDKRKVLSNEVSKFADPTTYWEQKGFSDLGGVEIVVQDLKGSKLSLRTDQLSMIAGALSVAPDRFSDKLDTIFVVRDPDMRRGMAGFRVMFLSYDTFTFGVTVHESGHVFDAWREVVEGTPSAFFDGPYNVPLEDPSVSFYSLGWSSVTKRMRHESDFLSGYGSTDPFENFAESFAGFVLSGRYFRDRANSSPALKMEYDFLLNAFNRAEFETGQLYFSQPYDMTVLPVDFDEVFASE